MITSFRVASVSIVVCFSNDDNSLHLEAPQYPAHRECSSLDEAMSKLDSLAAELNENYPNLKFMIYCLEGLDPFPNSLEGFTSPSLGKKLLYDISRLQLQNPTEYHFERSYSRAGIIVATIVDFSVSRVLVVGEAGQLVASFRHSLEIFDFNNTSDDELIFKLRDISSLIVRKPLGSSLLLGGFSGVFAFEAAYLVNALIKQGLPFSELLSVGIALLSMITFIALETLENRIIAASRTYTHIFRLFAWFFFLLFILAAPIELFTSDQQQFTVLGLKIASLGVLLCWLATSFCSIFINKGLSKRMIVVTLLFFSTCILGGHLLSQI